MTRLAAPAPATLGGLRVVYEDDLLAVIDKPAGLAVHGHRMSRGGDTVASRLRDAWGAAHPVHRLDRGTSGVLLVAKNADAARALQGALASASKTYLALVRGIFAGPEDLDYPIPSDPGAARVAARTRFVLRESFGWCSLVEAQPLTGRYHQVRRHLSHLRFPVANDTRYGTGWFNRRVRAELGLTHLALHAQALSFGHPAGHALRIEAPLPADFDEALGRLRAS